MDKMIFTVMSGLQVLDVARINNANEIANANTTAFKASFNQAAGFKNIGGTSDQTARSIPVLSGENIMKLKPGAIISTGRNLDVAVSGKGVLSVQSTDGKEVYSRRGDLKINQSGVLENGKGQLILGDGGPITIPPSRHLEINSRGDILIIPADAVGNNLQAVGRLKLSDAAGKPLRIRPDGLYETLDGASLEVSKEISVTSGAVEGSNVGIVGAMTKMIQSSRDYEMFIRMLKQAKEVDSASAGVLSAE